MIRYLLLLLFFSAFRCFSSHIVGGTLYMEHLSGNKYRVNLILYLDEVNSEVVILEDVSFVSTFSKSTNQRIDDLYLYKDERKLLQYTNPDCVAGDLQTSRVVYSGVFTFSDKAYVEKDGFYLTYERCCRNKTIRNIVDPYSTGITIYTEMPPLNIDKYNSSPVFNKPAGDYLCVERNYSTSFSAYDEDGDSLVYSLTEPLAGHSSFSVPVITAESAPYEKVIWQDGFSTRASIKGKRPLTINPQTGEISVNTDEAGTYVFAVLCEEYRKGKKIGQVTQEFQYTALNCKYYPPPEGFAKIGGRNKIFKNRDTITLPVNEREIVFYGITSIPGTTLSNFFYSGRLDPRWFTGVLSKINVNVIKDTLKASLVLDKCLPITPEPYLFGFVLKDAACPYPNIDTLYVYVKLETNNYFPQLALTPEERKPVIYVNDHHTFTVTATDADPGDIITFRYFPVGFDPATLGMEINREGDRYRFNWSPGCANIAEAGYKLKFVANDNNCPVHVSDTITVDIKVLDKAVPAEPDIPNIVTPNQDNANDLFYVFTRLPDSCAEKFKSISIYNRWGTVVYNSTDYFFKWDPEKFPDGTYYYTIELVNRKLKGFLQILH